MIAVKGRYNGSVVVLDEPAPVKGEVAVIVEFPDQPNSEGREVPARRFSLGGIASATRRLHRQPVGRSDPAAS